MNKKILAIMFLGIFMFGLVSSEELQNSPFELNESMQITNYCSDATCTFMNLTSLTYPNKTTTFFNIEMTQNVQKFNYTFIPDQLGKYTFTSCGNPSGYFECDEDFFEVTPTGEDKLGTGSSITIAIGLLVMFLVSGLLITLSFKINNGAVIIILYGISVILLFMATLFSMTLIDNILGNYVNIVKGYTAFVMVFKIILSMAVLSLTLYAGLRALKMYKMKRGLIDDD